MTLELYNTLTSRKEPFEPADAGHVRVYACGPTVYDYSHIGHGRMYVVYDVLVRHLRSRYPRVTFVRNVTDVEDKIVKRARENGEDPRALAERFRVACEEDVRALGCLPPDVEPRVTEHIDDIRALIETLVKRGHAYVSDGDVYFDVSSFPEYGKLSHRRLDEMLAGASERVDAVEALRKRRPADFALWKRSDPDELAWPSPWGPGRPGWHIECSAMSMKHLGPSFDLHGGGLDLVFPHHENELAQSEGATGKPFVRHWVHNGFVQVNKEKMSKSLGNFFVLREAFAMHEPEAVRYALLTVHYRAPLSIDWKLDAQGRLLGFPLFVLAEERLEYVYSTRERLKTIAENRLTDARDAAPEELARVGERIAAALDDDLNTPVALAHLAAFLKAVNELADRALAKGGKAPRSFKAAADAGFVAVGTALGIGSAEPAEFLARLRDRRAAALGIDKAEVARRIVERSEARQRKDFARSDAIREELGRLGVELSDGPGGTEWRLARPAAASAGAADEAGRALDGAPNRA
jgi:cysteinyl-tRNA synthetase